MYVLAPKHRISFKWLNYHLKSFSVCISIQLSTVLLNNNWCILYMVKLMIHIHFIWPGENSIVCMYAYVQVLHGCREVWSLLREVWILCSSGEILFLPQEHKIHIFLQPCNVLFIIWTYSQLHHSSPGCSGVQYEYYECFSSQYNTLVHIINAYMHLCFNHFHVYF